MTTFTLETFEEICDAGRAESESLDMSRWRLGDLGNLVMEQWADKTIEDFAKNIGQRKSTCYQYAAVSRFYPQTIRDTLRANLPTVGYSVLRDAMRLDTECTPAVIDWLEEVSTNGYTVDQAARELTLRLGRATHDSIEGRVARLYSQEDGYYMVVKMDDESPFEAGTTVKLTAK